MNVVFVIVIEDHVGWDGCENASKECERKGLDGEETHFQEKGVLLLTSLICE